jgi:hypothetical protein
LIGTDPSEIIGAMASKFTKSRTNAGTEKEGLGLLLRDPRFQKVDIATKRRIVELAGGTGAFGIQTFDAVMTEKPSAPINIANIEPHFPDLKLVEMKTTRKPIQDDELLGFFFGATEREYEMARTLGNRYLFAFVVLSTENRYRRPFAALLTLDEVHRRTLSRRVQYQVNFRSDLTSVGGPGEAAVVLLGDETDLPSVTPPEPDSIT